MKAKIKLLIISFLIFIIDRISKIIIVTRVPYLSKNTIIDNFLSITYIKNIGAAWSILEGKQIFLIMVSIIFLSIFLFLALKEKLTSLNIIQYSFVIGGGLGNLYDRIFLNCVIDFISIDIFNYSFPIFNLADIFICIGTLILIIRIIRSEKYDRSKSK